VFRKLPEIAAENDFESDGPGFRRWRNVETIQQTSHVPYYESLDHRPVNLMVRLTWHLVTILVL